MSQTCDQLRRAPCAGKRQSMASFRIRRGALICRAGQAGSPWRLLSGIAQIDLAESSGGLCAGLALPCDVLGLETTFTGEYAFQIVALTPCVIAPYGDLDPADVPAALATDLVVKQARAAALLATRMGSPAARVSKLLALICAPGILDSASASIVLPRLADMGQLTNLAPETVCRVIADLRDQGVLAKKRSSRQKSTRAPRASTFAQAPLGDSSASQSP